MIPILLIKSKYQSCAIWPNTCFYVCPVTVTRKVKNDTHFTAYNLATLMTNKG